MIASERIEPKMILRSRLVHIFSLGCPYLPFVVDGKRNTNKFHRQTWCVPDQSINWQVLAALAFSRNPDSLVFTNPRRWSVENLFTTKSIWDIPLVKPRFGCNFDMMLSQVGYDLSERIAEELVAFKLGHKCEMGFRAVHPSELNIKTHREFGVDGALQDMPGLEDYHISIMYRTFAGDANLFQMSVPTVIEHFQSAHELVVVVIEEDGPLFEDILDVYRASAPFPLRLVTEPDMMDGHVQQKYSKVNFEESVEFPACLPQKGIESHNKRIDQMRRNRISPEKYIFRMLSMIVYTPSRLDLSSIASGGKRTSEVTKIETRL